MPRHQRDEFSQQEFAARLERSLDLNPNAPPKFHGERVWLAEQMMKHGKPVSEESIRKWLNGLTMPSHDKVPTLAQILAVDADWLLYGNKSSEQAQKRIQHDVDAAAATNLVAGIIQMNGAQANFPPADRKAGNVHLNAVIARVSYPLHITVGTREDNMLEFIVPPRTDDAIVVGVVPSDEGFAYDLFEIPEDMLKDADIRRNQRVILVEQSELRQITSFAERL